MFKPLVDRVGLGPLVPVEFFGARSLAFLPNGSSLHTFEVGDHPKICIDHAFACTDTELLHGKRLK